ncbi:HAD-IE family hydrolase [Candidatus Woesearchaeota archaeon]|nr:HAD-IE family hydrolase [Candidatus Woesearchaeota archaeon]
MPENIHIEDKEKLKKKINKFKKDNFHVVADFDKTLTKAFIKGKKVFSSYSILREDKYLTSEYPSNAYALFNKYHPFEIDPNIPFEEKYSKMNEWWTLHWKLMVDSGMSKDVIKDIINKKKLEFRPGAAEFLDFLSKNNIPVLIFSSGLGNLIKEFLKSNNKLTDNVHVVSNFFVFDKNGKATGYKTPLIHVFNKNEFDIKDSPYYNQIKHRKNVLLLGDQLGDLRMSEGLEHNCIIKIGFLNENIEENFKEFTKSFDVVMINDSPMDEINKLIKEII